MAASGLEERAGTVASDMYSVTVIKRGRSSKPQQRLLQRARLPTRLPVNGTFTGIAGISSDVM
jgi:hypothetical protein